MYTKVSIIIPTYNEVEIIEKLIDYLLVNNSSSFREIIIVDGNSSDGTIEILQKRTDIKLILSDRKSRSYQLNLGASYAKGDVLYFLHADAVPPESYITDIIKGVQNGFPAGAFKMSYKNKGAIKGLDIIATLTSLDSKYFHYGDQSFYLAKDAFDKINGYNEDYLLMEGFEITQRTKKNGFKYQVIKKNLLSSNRLSETNGTLLMFWIYFRIHLMHFFNQSQEKMLTFYRKHTLGAKM